MYVCMIVKARHIYICDDHKNTIHHLRNQTKNRDPPRASDLRVDLSDKSIHSEVLGFEMQCDVKYVVCIKAPSIYKYC